MVAAVGSGLVSKVLVIGAAGMIGRKLARQLAGEELILHDVVPFDGASVVSDLSAPGEAEKLIASRPQLIFHLAAVVSGEAEADFDKGYRVNLDGTRRLFDAIRHVGNGYQPRVVFTSSIAVFGAPFPEAIGDEFRRVAPVLPLLRDCRPQIRKHAGAEQRCGQRRGRESKAPKSGECANRARSEEQSEDMEMDHVARSKIRPHVRPKGQRHRQCGDEPNWNERGT